MKRKLTQEDLITWANKMAMHYKIAGTCLSDNDCYKVQSLLSQALDIVVVEADKQGLDTSSYK